MYSECEQLFVYYTTGSLPQKTAAVDRELSFSNLLPTMNPNAPFQTFGDLLSSFDVHQMDSYFDDQMDLADTNALIQTELNIAMEKIRKLEADLAHSKRVSWELARRLEVAEGAILWCGEACFDEMAEKGLMKKQEVIDLTNE